jgi:uncharacterized protein YwqG
VGFGRYCVAMNKEQAMALVRGAGLGEDAEALVGLLAPSARLVVGEDDGDGGGGSWLGGKPRMRKGEDWPRWDAAGHMRRRIAEFETRMGKVPKDQGARDYLEGMKQGLGPLPLAFLGQLDLGEIFEEAPLAGWPEVGTLVFFYECVVMPWGFDPEDRGSVRVLYYPAGTELVEVQPPGDLDEEFVFPKRGASFERGWTLPTQVSDERLRDTRYLDAHMKLLAALSGADDASGVIHRCGGYADEVQGEMRLQLQLVTNGIYCGDQAGYHDPRVQALAQGAGEWELLFQVDSDEEKLGWMWGDLGRVYFWVRRGEMAQLDFSGVWGVLQCS